MLSTFMEEALSHQHRQSEDGIDPRQHVLCYGRLVGAPRPQ